MSPLILYQGKLLLKDNKLATDLECCCGCPAGCECLSILVVFYGTNTLDENGNPLFGEGPNQALADEWLAYALEWLDSNDIVGAIEDLGYEAVTTVSYAGPIGAGEFVYGWTASINIHYRCCQEIDEDSEYIEIYNQDTAANPWDLSEQPLPGDPSGLRRSLRHCGPGQGS